MGVLDKVLGTATTPGTLPQPEVGEDPKLAALPPGVRAKVKAKQKLAQAKATGEDPRVTQFYLDQDRRTAALSKLPSNVRKTVAAKGEDAAREQFLKANPDLDERITSAATVKVKNKLVPAEKAVQETLRLLGTPETNGLTRQMVLKNFNQIKGQLTPEIRKKYNIDEYEKAGLFGSNDGLLNDSKKALGQVVSTPGIKQVLGGIDRVRGTVAAGVKQGTIALDEALNNEDPRKASWSEFKSDVEKHIGFGEVYKQAIEADAQAKGGRSTVFGTDALGGNVDPETGKFNYNSLQGRVVANTFGTVGDVAGDPTTYLSFGTTKLAKSGLDTLKSTHGMEEVANLIQKKGWSALDDATKVEVTRVLLESKDAASKQVQKLGAEGLTAKQIEKIAKGGRQGVKVAGSTVVPFSPGAAGEGAKSVTSKFANKVATSEIQAGDNLTGLLGDVAHPSVVVDYDHAASLMTIDPGSQPISVLRKGGATTAAPGDFLVGDQLMDGGAKITHIYEDGSLQLKLDNSLENIERPFDIIPRHRIEASQGTLAETVKDFAPTQGKLLSSQNEALNGVPRIAQEAFDTEAADNLLRVANSTAPKAVDEVVQAGDQFIYRDADGTAKGILSIADGKVETLFVDPALRGEGISNRLYQAAEDSGIDVSKLGADELTPAGEKARSSFVQARDLPGRPDTSTAYRVTRDGGVETTRLWRKRERDGVAAYVLKDGENIVAPVKSPRQAVADAGKGADKVDVHAANSGIEVGQVVGRTPDGKLLLKPAMGDILKTQVGDHVPGLQGILEEIRPDGTWVVALDPSLFKKTADAATDAVSPAAASTAGEVQSSIPGLGDAAPSPAAADQASLFDVGSVPLADLPNVDPYAPPNTTPRDIFKVRAGEIKGLKETPEAQQKLFDMGIISTRDLKTGDRVRGLGGVVEENLGRRQIVAKLDDVPHTVIRADEVTKLDAAAIRQGDVLLDSGMMVMKVNADGSLVLKGAPPLGVKRMIEDTALGGLALKPNLADRLPGAKALRDSFIPRGSVNASARSGGISGAAAKSLGGIQAGERAAIGNALNDMKLRLQSVESRLRKALGREEGLKVLSDAFDVGAGEAAKVDGIIAAMREEAGTAVSSRAAQLNQAASALETLKTIRQEIAATEAKNSARSALPAGVQGTFDFENLGGAASDAARPGAVDQMPLVLGKDARKALALQPDLKEAMGIERQLDHLSAGFDWSDRAGRTTLRVETKTAELTAWEEAKAAAGTAGKSFTEKRPSSFVEIDLSRSAREVNDQVAQVLNDSTKAALKITDDKPFKLFEENPLTAYSYRHRTAQTIAVEQDMLKFAEEAGLVQRLTIPHADDGAGVAAHTAAKKNVPEGWGELKGWSTTGESVYADPAVTKEMSKVRAVLHNDEELKRFKKLVDQSSALWARQVLSPLTKGFGQQMRNLQSNIINASFGGLTLDGQKEAIRLQTGSLRKAGKIMREEGLNYEAAIAKLGLDTRDATILRYMREDDILNTGLYRTLDWGDTRGQTLLGGKADKAKELLSPLSPDNVLFKPGKIFNTAVEDNGRMALWISVFDKTGSREAASEAVRKYLFDYADLTTFESHIMKNVNVFYTFMRKNTALQMKVFMDRPALPLTVLKAKTALADKNADLTSGTDKERGLFTAGGALQKIIGGKGVVGIDDPVTAAIRTVDPFIQSAYYTLDSLSGGKLAAHLPPTERPTGKSVAKGYIGLTAGAPAEFLQTLAEVATGTDLRTDQELKESDTWRKLLSSVAPVWDQGETLTGMAKGDRPLRTNLLRMLAGITASTRGNNDKEQYSLNYAMLNELDQTIKLLQAGGVDVPTLSDLQDAGLVPRASDINKPRTVSLTPEMKKAEARKKIGLNP